MGAKIKNRISLLLSILWFVILSTGLETFSVGCGGASSLLGGTTTSGADSAEALTEAETSLYDSGPIDMPVTIAKLNSPSVESVTISVEAIGSESLNANLVRYAGSSDYRYTVTLTAGLDSTATPYLLLFNGTDETSSICTLDEDGSTGDGDCTIDGDLRDDIAIAALNEAQDQASPFLSFATSSVGTFDGPIVLTNAADEVILPAFQQASDPFGNIYGASDNGDGTYSLWSRGIDGSSEVNVIADSLTSDPQVITSDGTNVVVILTSGDILHFTTTVSGSINASPTLRYAVEDWDETLLYSIDGGLTEASFLEDSGYRLWLNSTGTVALMDGPPRLADDSVNFNFLSLIDLTGANEPYVLADTSEVQDCVSDMGDADTMYVFTIDQFANTFTLSRFSVTTSWDTATQQSNFDNREVLYADYPLTVSAMDVAENGDVVFLGHDSSADPATDYGPQVFLLTAEGDLKEITDQEEDTFYGAPKISKNGEFILFTSAVGGTTTAIKAHIPSLHAEHESITFFREASIFGRGGSDSLAIDDNYFVHIAVITATETTEVQLGVIDPRKNAAFDSLDL